MDLFAKEVGRLQRSASRIPVTDPTLRFLLLTQLLQPKNRQLGRSDWLNSETSDLQVLDDISRLSFAELTQFAKIVRPHTIAIDLGEGTFKSGASSPPPPDTEQAHVAVAIHGDDSGSQTQILVKDPSLRMMVLTQVIHHTQAIGLQRATCAELASWHDQPRSGPPCSRQPSAFDPLPPTWHLHLDLPNLRWEIARYSQMSSEQEMFQYFVKAHASSRMLTELFKVAPGKVRAAQEFLQVNTRTGRCISPPESDHIELVAAWDQMQRQEGLASRELFYRLHRKYPQFTMAQLYGVIKKEKRGTLDNRAAKHGISGRHPAHLD